jgi:membrane-bound metal-dependent hydrolase YbcI (DUF457 family)
VILWPAGLSLAIVWQVFRDPAIDYRLVVAGALLPDVVDGPFGGARVAHTLLFSVALLTVVMVATRGHRHARRRLLAVPIGAFVHLLLDAMWARADGFWWPFLSERLSGRLPALDHGAAVLVLEEIAGAVALLWWWRRFGLADRARRSAFFRTGRLPRDLVS